MVPPSTHLPKPEAESSFPWMPLVIPSPAHRFPPKLPPSSPSPSCPWQGHHHLSAKLQCWPPNWFPPRAPATPHTQCVAHWGSQNAGVTLYFPPPTGKPSRAFRCHWAREQLLQHFPSSWRSSHLPTPPSPWLFALQLPEALVSWERHTFQECLRDFLGTDRKH